jgi:Na+-translocating ferredoxin:NAD+ oxidoreductase RNF subunit RnfB
MCEHLHNVGCAWSTSACEQAALAAQSDTLRWLRENGCPWIASEVCMYAAYNGCTEILDFVIEQGEVLDLD